MAIITPEVSFSTSEHSLFLKVSSRTNIQETTTKRQYTNIFLSTLAPHALSHARKFERIYGLQEASPLGAGDFLSGKLPWWMGVWSVLEPGNFGTALGRWEKKRGNLKLNETKWTIFLSSLILGCKLLCFRAGNDFRICASWVFDQAVFRLRLSLVNDVTSDHSELIR